MDEIKIRKIRLTNFRCHESYVLHCEDNTTLILGANGCGKTSVLEAIYIMLCGKSFRASDKDIIKRKTDYYKIELELSDGEERILIYDRALGKKTFLIKDKKSARLPMKEKYPVILFLPEDLHLVSSSPTRKREYFDKVLAQIDDGYNKNLSRYNKALRQRNELLKQDYIDENALFSWNLLLARYGVAIRERRTVLVERINEELTKTYHSIVDNADIVKLNYNSHTNIVTESEYLKLLSLDYERDRITGHTNFGVHKDDYDFIFNNSLADGSASRGEVRSIVIALKFIEAREIFRTLGKKPVVLLDHVFSELDAERQKSLVSNFKDHQVILTSVSGVNV